MYFRIPTASAYNSSRRLKDLMMTDDTDGKDDKPKKKVYPNLKPAWKPGQKSANPEGRTPKYIQQHEIVAKIADNCDEAVDVVRQIMRKTRISPGDEVRLRAANSIIDRIIGKAAPRNVSASFTHRTVSADGTIIEGSATGAMSPLLQAAHAHLAQEEVRKLTPPAPDPVADTPASPAKAAPPHVITLYLGRQHPSARAAQGREAVHPCHYWRDARGQEGVGCFRPTWWHSRGAAWRLDQLQSPRPPSFTG